MSPLSWHGITFGIELEFMTPCPKTKRIFSKTAPASAARLHIAQELAKQTSLPIACACVHSEGRACAIDEELPEEAMIEDVGIVTFPGQVPHGSMLNRCFLFKPEFLARQHPLNVKRNWPGVEIATPVFHAGELDSGLATMESVLSNIRNLGLEITADESCGMHVHVGVESGMTLLLAQKISTLVVLLENTLLLRLVAPSRWANTNCLPVNENSLGAVQGFISNGLSVDYNSLYDDHMPPMYLLCSGEWNGYSSDRYRELFRAIWLAGTMQNLSGVLRKNGIHRCGFTLSLRNHETRPTHPLGKDRFEDTPSTVEFRYSQMTFDHELLRNWTEVVARIVVLAQADADTFKMTVALIMRLSNQAEMDGQPAWKQLMKYVLELEHRVPEWDLQLHRFARGKYISLLDEELLLVPE
ncbi:hypothetical protein ACHAPU_003357 [Fusarium lateritium]